MFNPVHMEHSKPIHNITHSLSLFAPSHYYLCLRFLHELTVLLVRQRLDTVSCASLPRVDAPLVARVNVQLPMIARGIL